MSAWNTLAVTCIHWNPTANRSTGVSPSRHSNVAKTGSTRMLAAVRSGFAASSPSPAAARTRPHTPEGRRTNRDACSPCKASFSCGRRKIEGRSPVAHRVGTSVAAVWSAIAGLAGVAVASPGGRTSTPYTSCHARVNASGVMPSRSSDASGRRLRRVEVRLRQVEVVAEPRFEGFGVLLVHTRSRPAPARRRAQEDRRSGTTTLGMPACLASTDDVAKRFLPHRRGAVNVCEGEKGRDVVHVSQELDSAGEPSRRRRLA